MAKNTADIVFKNGLIVTPSGVIEGGLAVIDGKIGAIGGDDFLPDAERVIDLAGKHLLPGAIDPECHLGGHRDLAADFKSETRAAAATGVTTWGLQLVSLAITGGAEKVKGPADIPNFTTAMPIFYEASKTAAIDFFLTPIVSTDEQVTEIPYLAREHGISSFKLHLQMQGPWKASWPAYFFDDGSIYSVFQAVAKLGAPAIALLHCENWEIAQVLQKQLMDAGRTDMGAWDDRSPAFTEVGHARTYLYYARIAGCPIYIVHCTTTDTVKEIERAKAEGLTVYSEIGTHYLVLHKDAWKINVPLRDRSTHEASMACAFVGRDRLHRQRSRGAHKNPRVHGNGERFYHDQRFSIARRRHAADDVERGCEQRTHIDRAVGASRKREPRAHLRPLSKKRRDSPRRRCRFDRRRSKTARDDHQRASPHRNSLVGLRGLGRHRLAGHDGRPRPDRHGMARGRSSRQGYGCLAGAISPAKSRHGIRIFVSLHLSQF